jgi:glycosyltransferase involved in cell wall biosynthesis
LKATLPGKASRPDVSLIVVAWNVAPYIAQALNSAAQQDLPGLEIIVVENNSTDGTRHIIEGYAHYKNFHCVYNDSNVGLGPARNQGMQLATGEYVAFLDGDDWLEPDAIRLSYEVARKNKSEIVYFGWNRVYPSGRSISMPPEDAKLVGSIDTADDRGVLLQYFQTAWNKLYSKRFLTEVGVSFEDAYYEDIPWSYSLLCQARSVFVLRKSLYNYRQRDGSILTTKDTKHFDAIKMLIRVPDNFGTMLHLRPSISSGACFGRDAFRGGTIIDFLKLWFQSFGDLAHQQLCNDTKVLWLLEIWLASFFGR